MARSSTIKSASKPGSATASRNGSEGIRTYRSALNYLNSMVDYERMTRVGYNHTNFNLARMSRILSALNNPQRDLKFIHVAGTKGKGSTVAMIAGMLQNCGFRVGTYTSPHLLDIRERICVDGVMIEEPEFTRIADRVAGAIASLSNDTATLFEALTAMAFCHFLNRKVDIAVIETGLGGRLDSTNVIKPEVCAITSISYDHMAQLGHTLEKIAEEKAGIFKSGVPVISAPQVTEVKKTLLRMAEKTKVSLRIPGDDIEFSLRVEASRTGRLASRVNLITSTSRFEHLQVPLMGEHQAINCAVALSVVDALKGRGFEIDDQKAVDGLAKVTLAGRMEMVCEVPRVLVDGAHNAASIGALMRAIGQSIPYDSMVVIFGCQQDKDINGMLDHIQIGADKVIFTNTGSPRTADPQELLARYVERTGKMAQMADTLPEALRIAKCAITPDDLICITGSFYLVGLAKRHFAQPKHALM